MAWTFKAFALKTQVVALCCHAVITHRDDGYELSVDPDRLDVVLVHHWLSTDAFWALGRSRETVERSVRASLNFAVYETAGGAQVAYARVVAGAVRHLLDLEN